LPLLQFLPGDWAFLWFVTNGLFCRQPVYDFDGFGSIAAALIPAPVAMRLGFFVVFIPPKLQPGFQTHVSLQGNWAMNLVQLQVYLAVQQIHGMTVANYTVFAKARSGNVGQALVAARWPLTSPIASPFGKRINGN
jgi:hypothetical protein